MATEIITLSTGKKIDLEKLNCLMSTTPKEIDELLLIMKTRRIGRAIKQIRIDNDLLTDEEREHDESIQAENCKVSTLH